MMAVAVLFSCVLASGAEPLDVDSSSENAAVESLFLNFLHEYGKESTYTEEALFTKRMGIFARNVDFINAFNRNSTAGGLRLGINQFADLTSSEFKQMYTLPLK